MYKVGAFSEETVIKRKGLVGEIHDLTGETKLSVGKLVKKGKKLELKAGKGVYVVADEIGLLVNDKELTNLDIVFVEGGALLFLKIGKIVLGDTIINVDGEETKLESEKVDTVTLENLRGLLVHTINNNYGLGDLKKADEHMDNLILTVEIYTNLPLMRSTGMKHQPDILASTPVRHTRLVSWSEDLGLGEYEYTK